MKRYTLIDNKSGDITRYSTLAWNLFNLKNRGMALYQTKYKNGKNFRRSKSCKVIQWIDTGIFQASICFSCGFTINEICSHLKKVKATEWLTSISDDVNQIKYQNWYALKREIEHTKTGETKTFFFIIIPRFDFNDDDCYVKLAHECLHICQFLLPDILNRDREFECEAYLHTHIMRQCIEAMKK